MDKANIETRFGLIRHAETVWNRERRVQGQMDSALTPEGVRQAERWGRLLKAFPWDRLLTSDTGRALDTARRINVHLKLAVETDARLRELDWGRWANRTIEQIRAEFPHEVAEQEAAGWNFRPPGGEPRRRQLERSLQALLDAAHRWPGRDLLVVTHEGVIKCLANHLCGCEFVAGQAVCIAPYHLHRLKAEDGRLVLDGLNALPLV
jgi:broad specificity phosphatase PhoE